MSNIFLPRVMGRAEIRGGFGHLLLNKSQAMSTANFMRPSAMLVKSLLPHENQVPPWSATKPLDPDEFWWLIEAANNARPE